MRIQNPLHGLSNIAHGNLPWNDPVKPPGPNRALPAKPDKLPLYLQQPLQGSTSNLGTGISNMNFPQVPRPLSGKPVYFTNPHNGLITQQIANPDQNHYSLMDGLWWNPDIRQQLMKLNSQYFQDEFPAQSPLPIYLRSQQ